jgi:hypothetical protein
MSSEAEGVLSSLAAVLVLLTTCPVLGTPRIVYNMERDMHTGRVRRNYCWCESLSDWPTTNE